MIKNLSLQILMIFLILMLPSGCTLTPEQKDAVQKARMACYKARERCFLQYGGIPGAVSLQDRLHNMAVSKVCSESIEC